MDLSQECLEGRDSTVLVVSIAVDGAIAVSRIAGLACITVESIGTVRFGASSGIGGTIAAASLAARVTTGVTSAVRNQWFENPYDHEVRGIVCHGAEAVHLSGNIERICEIRCVRTVLSDGPPCLSTSNRWPIVVCRIAWEALRRGCKELAPGSLYAFGTVAQVSLHERSTSDGNVHGMRHIDEPPRKAGWGREGGRTREDSVRSRMG